MTSPSEPQQAPDSGADDGGANGGGLTGRYYGRGIPYLPLESYPAN